MIHKNRPLIALAFCLAAVQSVPVSFGQSFTIRIPVLM